MLLNKLLFIYQRIDRYVVFLPSCIVSPWILIPDVWLYCRPLDFDPCLTS